MVGRNLLPRPLAGPARVSHPSRNPRQRGQATRRRRQGEGKPASSGGASGARATGAPPARRARGVLGSSAGGGAGAQRRIQTAARQAAGASIQARAAEA
ncbi:hypothetical protein PVAP13_1KG171410 [Panicum virgatum]|uniref:Uncharacterized protein n=1 Tax=Panicum virgatum TaxID=38727 RepID=A0A8T0XEH5_PANVG|nr:hypothetical protein PVAP13_1KG171410 [Panicum virgatum]